jgi:hypothetical protein
VKTEVKIDDKKLRVYMQQLGKAIARISDEQTKAGAVDAKFIASGKFTGGNSYSVPPRPRQKYIRTGRYGRSFKVIKKAKSQYIIRSNAIYKGNNYTRYVGGDSAGEGQARIHRGRWAIIYDVVQAQVIKTAKAIDREVKKWIKANK